MMTQEIKDKLESLPKVEIYYDNFNINEEEKKKINLTIDNIIKEKLVNNNLKAIILTVDLKTTFEDLRVNDTDAMTDYECGFVAAKCLCWNNKSTQFSIILINFDYIKYIYYDDNAKGLLVHELTHINNKCLLLKNCSDFTKIRYGDVDSYIKCWCKISFDEFIAEHESSIYYSNDYKNEKINLLNQFIRECNTKITNYKGINILKDDEFLHSNVSDLIIQIGRSFGVLISLNETIQNQYFQQLCEEFPQIADKLFNIFNFYQSLMSYKNIDDNILLTFKDLIMPLSDFYDDLLTKTLEEVEK
jgi:hypothetical protein